MADKQPPHSGLAIAAFTISAALLGYAALDERKETVAPVVIEAPAPVAEVVAEPESPPPFTPAERDAALVHLNMHLLPAIVRADLFIEQTETFPVQLGDLTTDGSAIWNGPYLENPSIDHPITLIWGSNPDWAGMSACGLEPAFNMDCFLWFSVSNYPQAWFNVLDMQYDEEDGMLEGRVRYDEKDRTLIIEYRTLLVQPETELQSDAIEDTLGANEAALTPAE